MTPKKEVDTMAKLGEFYVCPNCGNGVIVIRAGKGAEVTCCHSAMARRKLSLE